MFYNRDQYHILEQFYITVKIRGSLALLIRNSNVNKIQEIIHIILENLFLKLIINSFDKSKFYLYNFFCFF